ncbi:MAG: PHP domain-containing protein [Actinobacteria bacterium]|nr:PHP domain-containing protein [Actinomycetota bacterium]
MSPTNLEIAELLAHRGEEADGHRAKAYERAAGAALYWDTEASEVANGGGSLEELDYVGPSLARRIAEWLRESADAPEPPPKRAGFSSFARARSVLADAPGWEGRLRSDLQMHTTYSDGKSSIREMALGAAALGYTHLAITDHSQGLKIAGGMDAARLAQQAAEISAVNAEMDAEGFDLTILHGLEMNLDGRGEGDMEAETLEPLDMVVGSFHSALRSTDDQTGRYLGALANPHVQIIGHPSCRRFNRRPGLTADWPRVMEAAAHSGIALEINAHPHRQDLSLDLLRLAADAGVTLSIGTDAHDPQELRFAPMSLARAAEAGVDPGNIVNFWSRSELSEWIARLGQP